MTVLAWADKVPAPNDVKAGWVAFVVFIALAVAVTFLGLQPEPAPAPGAGERRAWRLRPQRPAVQPPGLLTAEAGQPRRTRARARPRRCPRSRARRSRSTGRQPARRAHRDAQLGRGRRARPRRCRARSGPAVRRCPRSGWWSRGRHEQGPAGAEGLERAPERRTPGLGERPGSRRPRRGRGRSAGERRARHRPASRRRSVVCRPFSIATADQSMAVTCHPRAASQRALRPSPQARSRARPGGREASSDSTNWLGPADQHQLRAGVPLVPGVGVHAVLSRPAAGRRPADARRPCRGHAPPRSADRGSRVAGHRVGRRPGSRPGRPSVSGSR